jgi:hypothetical protein
MANVTAMDIQKHLSGIDFPCDKQTLIKQAKDKGAPGDVVGMLNSLPNRQFESMEDVSSELGE